MPNIIEAGLIAKGKRFGIIASRLMISLPTDSWEAPWMR